MPRVNSSDMPDSEAIPLNNLKVVVEYKQKYGLKGRGRPKRSIPFEAGEVLHDRQNFCE